MKTFGALAIVVIIVLSGCTSHRSSLNPRHAAPGEMAVDRSHFLWRQWLDFGPFRTERAGHGIPWEWAVSILGGDLGVAWQHFSLVLTDGEQRMQTACTKRRVFYDRGALSVSLGIRPVLNCAVRPESGGEAWVMTLRRRGFGLQGLVQPASGGPGMLVESIEHAPARPLNAPFKSGYMLEHDGVIVAAVHSEGRRVWIDPAAAGAERIRAASIAAALLMFDPDGDRASGRRAN